MLSIKQRLITASIKRCSRWAEKVRYIGNPPKLWSFDKFQWLRQIHDDNSEKIIIQKSAQTGFTEFALNRTLFTLDQRKLNVLYALPSLRPDASNFSRGRINPAVEMSPYLQTLFTKGKSEEHKITRDSCNLYIRGGKSRGGFKQTDVGLIILDEADEMSEEAVGLVEFRVSGQMKSLQIIMLSTPSISGMGINAEFKLSNQQHYFFKCPSCSRMIRFRYPENLVVIGESASDPRIAESYYQCDKCKVHLEDCDKVNFLKTGEWVPKYRDRTITGYHINQFYSSALGSRVERTAAHEIRGRFSPVRRKEFFNSVLGLTFEEENARIEGEDIKKTQRQYLNNNLKKRKNYGIITFGMDVGQKNHHVIISGWNVEPGASREDLHVASKGTCLYYGTVKSFDEADSLIEVWRPHFTVIDAQPLKQEASSLAKKRAGISRVCFYTTTKNSKEIQDRESDVTIAVNRTHWMDVAFAHIFNESYNLPMDINIELMEHFKTPVRTITIDDRTGNYVSTYVSPRHTEDHYMHAYVYSCIAYEMVASGGGNESYGG